MNMVLLENNTTYNVVYMHPIENSVFGKLNFLQSIDKIKLLVIVIILSRIFRKKPYFFQTVICWLGGVIALKS